MKPPGFRRRRDTRHLLILQTVYADEITKKKKKALCLMYNIKESIFQCILFFNYLPNVGPKGL